MHVQAVAQVRIGQAGLAPALVRQGDHKRHRGIAESDGRGAGNCAGHVGHAVVHDPVYVIDGVGVGRGARGFKATALVDCDVHDGRTRLHGGQLCARYQLGGRSAGHENRTDNHVGLCDQFGGVPGGCVARAEHRAEGIIKIPHPVKRHVQHGHICAHTGRDAGRVGAHNAATDHGYLCRAHAGYAA